MKLHFVVLTTLCISAIALNRASGDENTVSTDANVMAEFAFTANRAHDDPFNNITLDLLVTTPAGAELRVPAFWAGGNVWKARYASPDSGTHRFKTDCSRQDDAGLHNVTGTIEIKSYAGDNPLYKHGPLRLSQNRRYLEHADGKPFFWLADTWWMGLCHRLHWPVEFKTLATDRKKKGFNVIQIVAGLYPDMHPFDQRGANEAGFPWEKDYASIRPEYFDAADKRLLYLVDEGFTPCIVGAWGYFIPWMGVEKAQQHWRYLIARYGAMPVVWCTAGEANLPWYLAKGFPYDDRGQVKQWTEVMRYIRATDPYRRPLTIHPTGIGRLSARNATEDASLLDFDMLQTPHGQRDAVEPTVRTVQESYTDSPRMPVINGEAAYEMLGDSLPTKWTRQMFWLCMTNGAAGHTYGANGIWQCNRRGQPHGPSPHHASGSHGYGKIPWDEAMNLPGSTQVALGKRLFEKYAWQEFEPHPEWAEYVNDLEPWPFHRRNWIWYPEGDPAVDAPAATRYFRKSFDVPESEPISDAHLWITADDRFVAYLNGKRIAAGSDWRTPQQIEVTDAIRLDNNVLAIEAENLPAPSSNPAGMLVQLEVRNKPGESYLKLMDGNWRCAKELDGPTADWTALEFDDTNWATAKEVASYRAGPWSEFATPTSYGPYATGIPGEVRIIYAPQPRSVKVLALEPGAKYRATGFDPQTGAAVDIGRVVPDENASWIVWKDSKFKVGDKWVEIKAADDWVLVLDRVQ